MTRTLHAKQTRRHTLTAIKTPGNTLKAKHRIDAAKQRHVQSDALS
ncbi:hypothetical protein [Paraburkholderia kirstenboschensis]|nr:hypothetical protein [Paraburkholderia kirstenboschensis]